MTTRELHPENYTPEDYEAPVQKTIQTLYREKDWDEMLRRIKARFEVDFDAQRLKALMENDLPPTSLSNCDDIFIMWVKMKLTQIGAFDWCGGTPSTFDSLAVPLHVCFLYLEETEEMLERLRNEKPRKGEDAPVAQSQVFMSPVVPHPIDRVAARGTTKE